MSIKFYKNKDDIPNGVKFSGCGELPNLGAAIEVRQLGPGSVKKYFIENEQKWLGVVVSLISPPAWYIRQNGQQDAFVYGAEINYKKP